MPRSDQLSLFASPDKPALPDGVTYVAEAITEQEERAAAKAIAELDLEPFAFQGFFGNRRVAYFGWRYDFNGGGLQEAGEMPAFLETLRDRAAAIAGLEPADLEHALVTEYGPGAGIGWHRDRPQFDKVVALSLLAPCRLRFRRKAEAGWKRISHTVEPRSIYILDGPGRDEWQHSIPPLDHLRYSITFRTMRLRTAGPACPAEARRA